MNRPSTIDVDVAVVGAGPAGLSAALVLGRASRRTVLIDAGPGRNQAERRRPQLPGPRRHRPRRAAPPRAQRAGGLSQRHHPRRPGQRDHGQGRRVRGRPRRGRRRVPRPAGGAGYRRHRRPPPIDGLAALWGRTVVHCPYCHGWELRGRPVAVRPHDSLQLLMALKLTHLTDDVVVCLDGALELTPEELTMLDAAGIAVRPQQITRLEAEGDQLRAVVFDDGTSLERTALYVHPAVRQASSLPAALGCRLLDNGLVEIDDLGHTSIDGVYTVGDMAHRPTNPLPGQQVTMAVAEGATAAIAIDQDLLLSDIPRPPALTDEAGRSAPEDAPQ